MTATKTHTCRVLNVSKQAIFLQVKPPGGDFFIHEQQVRLNPGKHALLPKSHLNTSQIANLRRNRMVKVTFDSEADEEA